MKECKIQQLWRLRLRRKHPDMIQLSGKYTLEENEYETNES